MQQNVIGVWRLVSCKHQGPKMKSTYPFGLRPTGRLIYTSTGFVSVFIANRSRSKFKSKGLFEGSPREKCSAMETFVSYFGRYRMSGNKVIHKIEVSLFPNWVRSQQTRTVELKANKLILTTEPFLEARQMRVAKLIWKRLK
jgi:hypothetical protein